jgi:hypothetical protein
MLAYALYLGYLNNHEFFFEYIHAAHETWILITKNKERTAPLQVHPISTLVQNHPANQYHVSNLKLNNFQ